MKVNGGLRRIKNIACIANEPWSNIPQRTQQLIMRLEDSEILYFEPHGTAKFDNKGRKVRPNITVYRLPATLELPNNSNKHTQHFYRKAGKFINKKLDDHFFSNTILWTTSPDQINFLPSINYGSLIYDCSQCWDNLPESWETELAMRADIIFAASEKLESHLKPCSDNIVTIENGSTSAAFARIDCTVPHEIENIDGAIICIMGPIRSDLDISPLLPAVERHREWTILLVGNIDDQPPKGIKKLSKFCRVLRVSPNTLLDYPDYLNNSSLYVQLLNRDTRATCIHTQGFYDALSSGIPMALFLAPEQKPLYPNYVQFTYTAENFTKICENAMKTDTHEKSRYRRRAGALNDWNYRAATVNKILNDLGY